MLRAGSEQPAAASRIRSRGRAFQSSLAKGSAQLRLSQPDLTTCRLQPKSTLVHLRSSPATPVMVFRQPWLAGGGSLALPLVMSLPCVYRKKAVAEAEEPQTETLEHHWIVEDMYTFENVGFTKAANGAAVGSETMLHYLACGDCGTGPIGWHSPSIVPHEFFVALSRVKHE
uniref:guanine nucleotide exchange factor MSS4-like n=1 Tax=Myxine glutinosa TaxID=7769 RepID=UPI00358FF538